MQMEKILNISMYSIIFLSNCLQLTPKRILLLLLLLLLQAPLSLPFCLHRGRVVYTDKLAALLKYPLLDAVKVPFFVRHYVYPNET